jgi:hypothetical protein
MKTKLAFLVIPVLWLCGCASPIHDLTGLGHDVIVGSTELAKAAIERNKPATVYVYLPAPPPPQP